MGHKTGFSACSAVVMLVMIADIHTIIDLDITDAGFKDFSTALGSSPSITTVDLSSKYRCSQHVDMIACKCCCV